MSEAQSWQGLPSHIKRQAAPEMLRGMEWHYYRRYLRRELARVDDYFEHYQRELRAREDREKSI